MTSNPACCTPDQTVRDAAQLMREHDCGCIPVVQDKQNKRLVGVVTDRDIACRATAEGKGPETSVRDVMSSDPKTCRADDDVGLVERIMSNDQVRRVPVVDDRDTLIGMIAQADLALNQDAISDKEVGKVVERISEPAGSMGGASTSR
jgi:CBS domain-containing protein